MRMWTVAAIKIERVPHWVAKEFQIPCCILYVHWSIPDWSDCQLHSTNCQLAMRHNIDMFMLIIDRLRGKRRAQGNKPKHMFESHSLLESILLEVAV